MEIVGRLQGQAGHAGWGRGVAWGGPPETLDGELSCPLTDQISAGGAPEWPVHYASTHFSSTVPELS